jgi:hypothetical protein
LDRTNRNDDRWMEKARRFARLDGVTYVAVKLLRHCFKFETIKCSIALICRSLDAKASNTSQILHEQLCWYNGQDGLSSKAIFLLFSVSVTLSFRQHECVGVAKSLGCNVRHNILLPQPCPRPHSLPSYILP